MPAELRQPIAGSRLTGLGAARPCRAWSVDELGQPFGKSGEWIFARTGIRSVRRIAAEESAVDLAVAAAMQALERAGRAAESLDCIIVATCSLREPDVARVAAAIAPRAPYVLLNAACSGFCYALAAADAAVRTGNATRVLLVGVEHMSRMLDPADLGTSILFGDGAGAAVVESAVRGEVGVGRVVWGSDGTGAEMIANRLDGSGRLGMAGRQVFRWAVETVPALAERACEAAGVSLEDIDVFVPHQANLRIIEAVTRRLGLRDVVVQADDIVVSGNTSAASVPLALCALVEDGRAKSGQLGLLVGFGAGLSYAGQVVVIP